MLKGQAKADYQRHYMRCYRAEGRDLRGKTLVRPSPISGKTLVRPTGEATHLFYEARVAKAPELDADGNPIPEY